MKHSKLFLTGMAALLLSFGLMMTGCDSGGDSDSGDPINAGDYISIEETTPGADDPATAAVYTVTVKQPIPTTNKAVFANVADAAVEYIPALGDETTKAAQAAAIVTKLNAADGAKYIAAVGTTVGTDDHIITLTARTPGAIANAPAVAIETYEAPQTSDVTGTTTANVTDGHTALAVTAGSGGFKTTGIKVYINSTGETVTISGSTLTGAGTEFASGTIVSTGGTIVVKGLTAADSTGGAAKLKSGVKTNIVIKADAQQSGATAVAAHTGVPVVIDAQLYTLASIDEDKIAFTPATTSPPAPAKVNWHVNSGSATGDTPLDPDFDTALIAVLSNLVNTDTVEFDANGNANAVVFTVAPTAAAKLQAVLDNVGGTTPGVTLGGSTQTTTIAAGSTVTIPAGVTVTVDAANILSVAGTLAFTDNTSVLALIGTGGELKATADTAKFHANATTTTGAGLSLIVTASDLTTATGWSSDDPSTGASVTVTTGSAASGSGAAYVLGNASLVIKNVTTGAIHAAIPEVSTAAGTAAVGGIKAATGSAVVITGKAI